MDLFGMIKTKKDSTDDAIVVNPAYGEFIPIWKAQIASYAGETAIKKAGETYLPLPSGKIPQKLKQPKYVAEYYAGYIARADFPEALQEGVSSMTGMVFEDAGIVELPEGLKYLFDVTTSKGDSLKTAMRYTLQRQLITGRILALWTVDAVNNNIKMVFYDALSILDWHSDNAGNVVAITLDESSNQFVDGKWEWVAKYRVIGIDADMNYYNAIVSDTTRFNFAHPEGAKYDNLHGMVYKNGIPGIIFNSTNIGGGTEMPVTLKITESAIKAYINSADYEQSLSHTAQPTLYTINCKLDPGVKLCLGAAVALGVENPEGNPEIGYLETTGVGLNALCTAIENHKKEARKNIELIENAAEAGVALNTRLSVKTASLQNVALTLEQGWVQLLKMAATWMNAGDSKITVKVNTDFRKDNLLPQDIVQLAAMIPGGGYSKRDLFFILKKAKLTQFEKFDEWDAVVEENGIAPTIIQDVTDANSQ